ncbi:precorrin-2 dehydrogenase/sirohydrochlorin ferrochelatase family protein [Aurantiacibacter gangjinensis]|uniref:precorrin-2 dehydrogenase n=1 Tax=Aurantiacibacter gangjinensis TaxID=502682 RepID=A0A0G9MMX0_9SPHN|nr:NAD(P)-dependent oxidoreductase [Aurantiacibacter gangjinensis]APE28185.1 Siroheme synthase / Precorrin-2 oxidase / Sirohydrochlorin ferrochelatase [Aurantiacibacter gangjinensis]KLE32091.1 siroheme synthase [Aurantiacibacter gangjinensis]
MRSLPLFHRIAGQPVIVLGEGEMAEPKRRLIERAGGRVVSVMQAGIDEGARLAFVAHDDEKMCEGDAIRLRCAGLLVNVVDRPDLCDFTTPSLLERDPVLIAVSTSGASAGLAKQLRLRLEKLLPANLGELAEKLSAMRGAIKARFPSMPVRRRALDDALGEGGYLDVLAEGSADRVQIWLENAETPGAEAVHRFTISSDDPEDLTLRQARLLGSADAVIADPAIPATILDRARADAERLILPHDGDLPSGLVIILERGEFP